MQKETATFDSLTKEGWHVKDEAKERLVEEARAHSKSLTELLLATDLRKIGKPFLPDGFNHADSTTLKGQNVLQILSVEDVSKPSKGVGTSSQRLLRLKLTDSKLACIAAEFKPVPQLSGNLPPGTKVCCTNASVKLGVLLLDAKSVQVTSWSIQRKEENEPFVLVLDGQNETIQVTDAAMICQSSPGGLLVGKNAFVKVLGGQVEELLEAWTFQRKFGNVQRPAGASDDTEQPPAFKSFIPGRRHNQAGHMAPQQQANYPMADQRASAAAATAAGKGMPDQASLGTAGKTHQPPLGSPPPGFRAPRGLQLHSNASQVGISQTAAASGSSTGAETAAGEGPEAKQAQQQRRPQEPKGQMQHNQAAVKHKLLDRLADEGPSGRGRGRGRGRRGRRGHDDDEAGMTLEEYEALQQRPKVPLTPPSSKHPAEPESQLDQDEALARQLQQQMDLEEQQQQQQPFQHQQVHQQPHAGTGGPATFSTPGTDVARDLAQSLFAFDRQEDEGAQYGRGRGRGRGRGGRRGGRGRGR